MRLLDAEEQRKVYSHNKIRTSLKDRTLESMFPVVNPAQLDSTSTTNLKTTDASSGGSKTREIKESECYLTSVNQLRQTIVKNKHKRETRHQPNTFCSPRSTELTEILEKHTFVGIVDLRKSLALLQYSTNLYLVNYNALA